jgi:uncharacterized protein
MHARIAIAALLLSIAAATGAAGFDCTRASSAVERTVCADPRLSRLDEELAAEFRSVLGVVADPAALRERQRAWLAERDACADQRCLERLYLRRVASLRAATRPLAETRAAALGIYERRVDGAVDPHAATLTIAAGSGDLVHVTGEATWVGDAATGNVNTGSIDGMVRIEGNAARYDLDGCQFAIEFLPDALIVHGDNGGCGGLNVSFDGDYGRVRP